MKVRRILTIIPLILYWPGLFIIGHIAIPKVVYQAQVSDKGLHFIAYFLLTFLLWFSISPDRKVNWRKAGVWMILFVVVFYGIMDEVLQINVGRSCDVYDFLSDLAGAVAALIMFTFLAFWPALLATLMVIIFGITNVARADISKLVPIADMLFHFFAFAALTGVWIKVLPMYIFKNKRGGKIDQIGLALAGPAFFLVAVKLSSEFLGRTAVFAEFAIAFCGIATAGVIYAAYLVVSGRRTDQTAYTADHL
ncbi:MAG: VanZ family protein [Phycisphaerae bacterium]|nr:VanZ family protein [Phycisphaerae bacterium]